MNDIKNNFNSVESIHIMLMGVALEFRRRAMALRSNHPPPLVNDHVSNPGNLQRWTQAKFISQPSICQRTQNTYHVFKFDPKIFKACSMCGVKTKYFCPGCNDARLCVIHHHRSEFTCYELLYNGDTNKLRITGKIGNESDDEENRRDSDSLS
jgi:hypothetical protein